jgi:hypothetical protein
MRRSVGVVRSWQFARAYGEGAVMNASSLVEQVLARVAVGARRGCQQLRHRPVSTGEGVVLDVVM